MDVFLSNIGGSVLTGAPVVLKSQPSTPKVELPPQRVEQAPPQEIETVAQAKLEVVKKAAANFRNFYAVSDVRFTIYKDTGGQYITRFTSLRDGSVNYFPEPAMLAALDGQSSGLLVETLV